MGKEETSDFAGDSTAGFAERCSREIVELHQFFEAWLGGRLPKNKKSFSRFTDATAPSMMLVSTGGTLLSYDQLVAWIYDADGSEPGFRLWVEQIETRQVVDSIALMVYEEWQDRSTGRNVRQSTALFEQWEGAPNGVRWLHVHETTMPQANEERTQAA